MCFCAAETTCATISLKNNGCSFLLSPYPVRVRNSAILTGISLLVSAIYFMICFTNAYEKGKALRRAKRLSEISLGTIAKYPSEEKNDVEEEL